VIYRSDLSFMLQIYILDTYSLLHKCNDHAHVGVFQENWLDVAEEIDDMFLGDSEVEYVDASLDCAAHDIKLLGNLNLCSILVLAHYLVLRYFIVKTILAAPLLL
jgi:hypothetical protein